MNMSKLHDIAETMAIVVGILFFLGLCFLLFSAASAKKEIEAGTGEPVNSVTVSIDRLTGCHYLQSRWGDGGLVPRIAADGKTHFGCKPATPTEDHP